MCELAALPVKFDISFPQYACFLFLPFGGLGVLIQTHSKEEISRDDLSYDCAHVGLLFPIYLEHNLR